MVADNEQWSPDGQTIVTGGVSSGLAPDAIRPDELAWARNINLRDGKPETPWGLVERTTLPFGRVQGVKEFSFGGGELVMSIEGRIYTIVPDFNEVTVKEFEVPVLRQAEAKTAYMLETTGSFIIQDGISAPLIFNGVFLRIAADDEIPLGKQMAYDGQRVWFVQGLTLNALDIGNGEFQSELKFLEAQTFTGGGKFSLPSEPTGLAFMPSSDGATSFGVLIAFGINWTIAFRANIGDRSEWLKTPGFKTRLFPDLGCRSHFSIVTSNSDIYWRDTMGEVRNMRQAVSDYDSAGTTAISREIARLIDHESHDMLENCHAIVFRNKMFMTASPFFVFEDQVAYRDMFSLDFTPIGSQGEKRRPVFDGERDGVFFTHLATLNRLGKERAFVVSKDSDGTNRLWEIVPEERNDVFLAADGSRVINRIESDLEYRSFSHESNLREKTFGRVDFWLSEIQGLITGSLYYKRDSDPQWIFIDDFDFCTLYDDQSQKDPHVWKELGRGHQDQVISRSPPDLGEKLKGHSFQVRFLIKGVFRMEKVLIMVQPIEIPVHAQPRDEECQEEVIELVGTEYKIPVVTKTLFNYVDENGNNYVDENGDNYQG